MINKVSDITYQNIADYIRLNVTNTDTATQNELNTYLNIAKNYISNYTGIAVCKYVQTVDTVPNSSKTYYYKNLNNYIKFEGTVFVPGTTYYEKIYDEDLDEYADFIIVVYILCQDMYDNRTMYVDAKSINNVVQTILNMHTRNNI